MWLDGVHEENADPVQRARRRRCVRAPTCAQLTRLERSPARGLRWPLSRRGLVEGQDESVFRSLSDSAGSDAGKLGGLKHASNIAVESCIRCGGAERVVVSVEDRSDIRAILHPLDRHGALEQWHYRRGPRWPPAAVCVTSAGRTADGKTAIGVEDPPHVQT